VLSEGKSARERIALIFIPTCSGIRAIVDLYLLLVNPRYYENGRRKNLVPGDTHEETLEDFASNFADSSLRSCFVPRPTLNTPQDCGLCVNIVLDRTWEPPKARRSGGGSDSLRHKISA
jgi:hypothetical protein